MVRNTITFSNKPFGLNQNFFLNTQKMFSHEAPKQV